MTETKELNPVQKAVEIVGGQSALARALTPPVTPQAVQQWCASGVVPVTRARAISQATGGAITCAQLRPDVFMD